MDTPRVVAPPPLLYGGALLLAVCLNWVRPLPLGSHGFHVGVGLAIAVAGVALGLWAQRGLRVAGTEVNPYRPTTQIVETGAYRLSRNPIYVALTISFLGLTWASNTAWGLVLLVPLLAVMHVGVIRREELYLESKFGDSYRRYVRGVRRYI